jgi:hypothetical protein
MRVFVFDLGPDHPIEDLLPALGELRCSFGHGPAEDCGVVASHRVYDAGPVSFRSNSNGVEEE